MKRHITYFVFLFALAAGASGCNKRPIVGGQETRYPVVFSSGVNKTVANKVAGDAFEVGDVLGICSYPAGGAMFSESEFTRVNVPYVQQTGKELGVRDGIDPLYFPVEPDVALGFKGYYPYSEQMSAQGVISVEMADQHAGAAAPLLYSDNMNNVVRTANYVELKFQYMVAQVILNIKYDPVSFPNGDLAAISAVSLEGDGLYTACDFRVTDGTVTATGGSMRRAVAMQPGVETSVATMVPARVTGLKVMIVTPGHTYVATPSDMTYVAGYQYTYNVTLKGGGDVVIGNAVITDWEAGNGGGEVIPAEPQEQN